MSSQTTKIFTKQEIQVGFLRYKNWKFITIAKFFDLPVEEVKRITKSLTSKIVTVEDSIKFRETLNQIEENTI